MTETRNHTLEAIAPPNNQVCTHPAESATGFCLARATHVHKFEELSDGDWKLNSVLLCAGHVAAIARVNSIMGHRAVVEWHGDCVSTTCLRCGNPSSKLGICTECMNTTEVPTLCKCGKSAATEPHPCPFAQDLYGDSETLCTCCDDCRHECAMDI